MARPGIVRADTIDLQNQTSPSTQDHSRKSSGSSIAPHQAAELRHVQEERHSEEETLSHAWQAANGLSDEPPSDDEVTNMRVNQSMQQHEARHDDSDAADGEGDDMDDDIMDKISSSPSISDGGYSPFPSTPQWPQRASSLHTSTPIRSIRHSSESPNVTDSDVSSPFVTTPTHLPATPFISRSPSPFPFFAGFIRKRRRRPSTPTDNETDSSSPFVDSPAHLPLNYPHSSSFKVQSESLHQRILGTPELPTEGEGIDEGYSGNDEECKAFSKEADDLVLKKSVGVVLQETGELYRQPNLVKSASDLEFEAQLLPASDPLLDDVFYDSTDSKVMHGGTADDDDAWETESDTVYSDDSFESAAYRNDDETHDLELPADDRFIDSGWGGECLQETEDIDFEFVYALHTFVATVEGQANAQKGDTMVLLDDSNSYWWLVRVVKDSTIGYLPAEHIETPTERLARLNKHRNVDLSQTMLGDTTEKTKNPLKKAMRRRNAKTVQFTSPTYIEPSEYEYSTDEESDDDMSLTDTVAGQSEQSNEHVTDGGENDEISSIAPLKVKEKKRDMSPEKQSSDEKNEQDRRRTIDESRTSDEQFDHDFNTQKQSRNGTVRNTDSFFRDESIETRKITLTPNILRDDSAGGSNGGSAAGKNSLDRGPSLELLEKDPRPGKGEKRKEKKPGMLSGLFKRKEKKTKTDDAGSSKAKLSGETLRESPSSEEASPIERTGTADGGLQRSSSKAKLQKSSPNAVSPIDTTSPAPTVAQKKPSAESISSAQSTPRSVSPISENPNEKPSIRVRATETISTKLPQALAPVSQAEPKPTKVKRAKTREALDIESSPDDEMKEDPFADPELASNVESKLNVPLGPGKLGAMSSTERLSDSPVHITSADAMPEDSEPPALVGDSSSSSADELTSLRSSPSPPIGSATTDTLTSHTQAQPDFSPQLSQRSQISPTHIADLATNKKVVPPPPTRSPPPQPGVASATAQRSQSPARNGSTSTTISTLSPTTSSIPAWSDAHLRAYMDDSSDVKDLLVVVHDTTGVMPVGPDHPLMNNLFVEERGKVKELDSALDQMLGQWLAKKKAVQKASTNAPATKSKLAISSSS